MPSTFRVPKAEITGAYGKVLTAYARRTFGQIPDNLYVLWHNREGAEGGVQASSRRSRSATRSTRNLKTYAQLASAGVIGCSWCLDFGYFLAHNEGLDVAKVREVPRWRESDVFTDTERAVLEYAEAMSTTPLDGHRRDGGQARPTSSASPAVVELTMMVAIENERSRFNARHGPGEPGVLRRVRAAARTARRRTVMVVRPDRPARSTRERDRRLRRAPQPAVHRRLRDARLGGRCRGRAAGDLAAVGEVDRAEVRDARAYLVRITTRLALNRMRTDGPASRVVRRTMAARAAAHHSRRRRGRRAGRQRVDGDAARPGDPEPDRAGGVRAARGLRLRVRRDRRRRRQDAGGRAPDRAPGPRHVDERRPTRDVTPVAARRGDRPVPRGHVDRATCRACSTCWRRTWCWSPTAAV